MHTVSGTHIAVIHHQLFVFFSDWLPPSPALCPPSSCSTWTPREPGAAGLLWLRFFLFFFFFWTCSFTSTHPPVLLDSTSLVEKLGSQSWLGLGEDGARVSPSHDEVLPRFQQSHSFGIALKLKSDARVTVLCCNYSIAVSFVDGFRQRACITDSAYRSQSNRVITFEHSGFNTNLLSSITDFSSSSFSISSSSYSSSSYCSNWCVGTVCKPRGTSS